MTLYTLMTLVMAALGIVLLGSAVVVAGLIIFFSRRVEIGVKAIADLSRVKADLANLDELVLSLIKRQASRSERAAKPKKAAEEDNEEDPVDIRERIAAGTFR